MALYKRNDVWWIDISHDGRRIQKSSGTSDKLAAQQLHDKIKAELWRVSRLDEKPHYTWEEAVIRWVEESQHKRSLDDDKSQFRWLHPHLNGQHLHTLTRDKIDEIAKLKELEGVKPATVNRMLALIRAILRKAVREWEWIEQEPVIRMRKEDNRRIRWLTPDQANRLIQELPEHLAVMAAFSLATGLRQSNVTQLQWSEVDLVRGHAWVHPDQAKTEKAIPVPLNQMAMTILQKQLGKHPQFVFVYQGHAITQCTTKAWYNALARAGIQDFRWHDLRHTWASWHVQNGTSLYELQQLGGWASHEMVLRYAHLNSDHLKHAAERINVTNLLHLPSNEGGLQGLNA